eukprot:GHVQ01006156.1.p1 GENE.GHVQ01006156.1~~GHVQ01006156.1.p1  ORF type:complete len:687 (-),score=63.74 GHVQ01006156.1:602-2662(-)
MADSNRSLRFVGGLVVVCISFLIFFIKDTSAADNACAAEDACAADDAGAETSSVFAGLGPTHVIRLEFLSWSDIYVLPRDEQKTANEGEDMSKNVTVSQDFSDLHIDLLHVRDAAAFIDDEIRDDYFGEEVEGYFLDELQKTVTSVAELTFANRTEIAYDSTKLYDINLHDKTSSSKVTIATMLLGMSEDQRNTLETVQHELMVAIHESQDSVVTYRNRLGQCLVDMGGANVTFMLSTSNVTYQEFPPTWIADHVPGFRMSWQDIAPLHSIAKSSYTDALGEALTNNAKAAFLTIRRMGSPKVATEYANEVIEHKVITKPNSIIVRYPMTKYLSEDYDLPTHRIAIELDSNNQFTAKLRELQDDIEKAEEDILGKCKDKAYEKDQMDGLQALRHGRVTGNHTIVVLDIKPSGSVQGPDTEVSGLGEFGPHGKFFGTHDEKIFIDKLSNLTQTVITQTFGTAADEPLSRNIVFTSVKECDSQKRFFKEYSQELWFSYLVYRVDGVPFYYLDMDSESKALLEKLVSNLTNAIHANMGIKICNLGTLFNNYFLGDAGSKYRRLPWSAIFFPRPNFQATLFRSASSRLPSPLSFPYTIDTMKRCFKSRYNETPDFKGADTLRPTGLEFESKDEGQKDEGLDVTIKHISITRWFPEESREQETKFGSGKTTEIATGAEGMTVTCPLFEEIK